MIFSYYFCMAIHLVTIYYDLFRTLNSKFQDFGQKDKNCDFQNTAVIFYLTSPKYYSFMRSWIRSFLLLLFFQQSLICFNTYPFTHTHTHTLCTTERIFKYNQNLLYLQYLILSFRDRSYHRYSPSIHYLNAQTKQGCGGTGWCVVLLFLAVGKN